MRRQPLRATSARLHWLTAADSRRMMFHQGHDPGIRQPTAGGDIVNHAARRTGHPIPASTANQSDQATAPGASVPSTDGRYRCIVPSTAVAERQPDLVDRLRPPTGD